MAETKSSEAKPTTTAAKANPLPEPPQDRVAMVSLTKTGEPDQTPGFTFIGDKETALAAAKVQFTQQAVSAVDEASRIPGVPIGEEADADTGSIDPDTAVQALKDAQDAAAKRAESQAEALVNARFEGS